MLLTLPEVLPRPVADALCARLAAGAWADGNATSGAQAAMSKRNRQLPRDDALAQQASHLVLEAVRASPLFLSAALPRVILPPLFNRYDLGDGFGIHVDNAIRSLPDGTPLRTDLSFTLFLSDPDSYDGGELVVETAFGAQEVKLEAGAMVLYPSSSLHKVNPVTRGVRICAFSWLQSLVRDADTRGLLFDLDQSVQVLAKERGTADGEVVRLTAVYHNLMRRFAEA